MKIVLGKAIFEDGEEPTILQCCKNIDLQNALNIIEETDKSIIVIAQRSVCFEFTEEERRLFSHPRIAAIGGGPLCQDQNLGKISTLNTISILNNLKIIYLLFSLYIVSFLF